MATLYTQQDKNVRKTWFLMTMFLIVIIAIGWAFSYIYESPGILVFAIVLSIGMNLYGYFNSDKLILRLYKAKEVTRESHRDLWNSVENLSITAGLPMPKLYIIPDKAPNAFATGRDKEHASLAVTEGLLSIMNKNELEGVIAHELSHIGNRDILVMTIVVVLVGFVALLSDIFIRMSIFGGRSRDSKGNVGVIIMIVGFALAILSPLVAKLIQLAISRKREFLADAGGVLLTRYPDGLASALKKLGSYKGEMKRVNNATAHLFISNPHGHKKRFLSKLFLTHPPIEERISALRSLDI